MTPDPSAANVQGLAEQLRALGVTVKLLTVGDDEMVVLEAPDNLTPMIADEIRQAWRDAGGAERAVMTVGVRIASARYEDVEEARRDAEDHR